MRPTKSLRIAIIVSALVASALAAATLPGGLAGAQASPPNTSPFFSESNADINQDVEATPIVGNFSSPNAPDDIIWYVPGTGVDRLWVSDNSGGFDKRVLPGRVNGFYTPIVGDFAGDSRDDILWYAPGGSGDSLWVTTSAYTWRSVRVSINGTYKPTVIVDPAGFDDIIWTNSSTFASVWSFDGTATVYRTHNLSVPKSTQPYTGDFNGDRYGDILWYGAGAIADQVWSGRGNGTYTARNEQLDGTYTPIVADFTPGFVGARDDVLLYNESGTSVLLQGLSSGAWAPSFHVLPLGTPVVAEREWTVLLIVRAGQPDWAWYKTGSSEFSRRTHNTEIGPESVPVVGDFVGFARDIFWYAPSVEPEHMFHSNYLR